MTERALQGASLEATVGQLTTDRPRSAAAARAVSRTLPPPAPTIVRAFNSRAAALTRSISAKEHSPPKRWTACFSPDSSRLRCQVCASRLITVLPAMIRTGPSSPRVIISCPSAAVAPLPWVYRLGEVKTVSMAQVLVLQLDSTQNPSGNEVNPSLHPGPRLGQPSEWHPWNLTIVEVGPDSERPTIALAVFKIIEGQ